ncbi:hypothetical protein SLS62_005463 [Diatrype stigma]|uniref:Uncharacterized protein n=1 Tax=Diatrype stigma TaxID=117547 RepID=A0AAN9YSR4_9PEZI
MKFLNIILLATSAAALAVNSRSLQGRNRVDHEAAVLARQNVGQGEQGLNDLAARRHGHHRGGNKGHGGNNGGNQGGGATNGTAAASINTIIRSVATGQTLVLKEVNGVPGNECLTFRNNGEIVDAACVDDAADRQMTPATVGGASVTKVQRSFTAGFRPDLVGVEACVGFNGTHFRAENCASSAKSGIEMVQFDGTALRAPSGACASGHDDLAQLTVDPNGANCAQFDTTAVTPTAS